MHGTRIVARSVGLGLLLAGTAAIAAQGTPAENSPQRIAAPASVVIPCDQSPFGKAAPMIRDLEPLYLMNTSTDKRFEEWRPPFTGETPPLLRVYGTSIETPTLAGKTLRKAVSVDLNGDGRDEVVAAYSDGSSVILTVYERSTGLSPTPQVIDTWIYTETEDGAGTIDPASIGMVAGDLDGSRDKQQEIAVSWHIASGNHGADTRVVVLKGDSSGHIAQADNATSGNWRAGYSSTLPRLAVGDFLLTGRDQLVLVNFYAAATSINYDLIEFNDGSNSTLPTAALSDPLVGNSLNVRSKHFFNVLKDASLVPYFADDNGNSRYVYPSVGVEALDADAGDVGDTAAAELVVHLMFQNEYNVFFAQHRQHVLGQRLLHFDTARDNNNAITGVTLGNPGGGDAGQSYDSSRVLEMYGSGGDGLPYPAPAFAAAVADVDGIAGKEIVTVRAGRAPTDGVVDSGHLTWWAYKVQVRLKPSFQYKNQGSDTRGSHVKFINWYKNGNDVVFNSHGPVGTTYTWDFGDGNQSNEVNPTHIYSTTQTYNVTLTATAPAGPNQQAPVTTAPVSVSVGGFDETPKPLGYVAPPYAYRIDPSPTYSVEHPYALYSSASLVKIAAGDMNRDGLPEVFATAKDINGTIHRHVFRRQANGSFGYDTAADNVAGVGYLELLLSDFDGDSPNAVLSNVSGDCRAVTDNQVRSLTWTPPYFLGLQNGASARYGKSSSNSNSVEESSSSYTSEDITGFIGVSVEINAPIIAQPIAEIDVKASFGHAWQSTKGKLHGTESSYDTDEGHSISDSGSGYGQDGVMTTERIGSDCYTYVVTTSAGPMPDSSLRACAIKPAEKVPAAPGVFDWNYLTPEPKPIQVPLHWVPAQRDWASLALFHVPTSGGSFSEDHGADKATDGLFTTSSESDGAHSKPYLDIDLGRVQDISAVRVFPTAEASHNDNFGRLVPIDFKKGARDLQGFRLYASSTSFNNSPNLPTTASATTFVPGGISTFVQDTGVEAVYNIWNIWTGNPASGASLRARYLRLQTPSDGKKIRIAEIQVFGPTHAEPPTYPDAVCDATVGDGLFKATVYDDVVSHTLRTIEVRGDLRWTGAEDGGNSGVPDCANDVRMGRQPIWDSSSVGDSSAADWSLSQTANQTTGQFTSIDSSTHVGVEFEAKAGLGVMIAAGASTEITTGVTKDHQSSVTTGSGFAVSGEAGGFNSASVGGSCRYYPRPYAFQQTEYSNAGFRHDMYTTDYVVKQSIHTSAWQRSAVPGECLSVNDGIFANDFE